MNKFGSFAAFVFGAAAGSFATWIYAKNKYEAIIQEEIDSVKKVFSDRKPVKNEFADESDWFERARIAGRLEFPLGYAEKIQENGYSAHLENEMESSENRNEEEEDVGQGPYVISPDEFGEKDDYEQISLTYYSDGVLADEDEQIIWDVDEVVGEESLGRFGEYEDDSVFVRNDKLKCDYEILKDQRNYPDICRNAEG